MSFLKQKFLIALVSIDRINKIKRNIYKENNKHN